MKKLLMLVFILVLSLGLAACATEDPGEDPIEGPIEGENGDEVEVIEDDENDQDEDIIEDEEGNDDEIVDTEPEANTQTVTLYFVSDDYVETGDESGDVILTEEREIILENTSLEEAVVNELMDGPEDTETMHTLIPDSAQLLGVRVEEGTAFVDFSSEGLSGGSMQETYTIEQIVDTLTGLDTVDRVQFLIDGEEAESLMGHIEISEPFEEK